MAVAIYRNVRMLHWFAGVVAVVCLPAQLSSTHRRFRLEPDATPPGTHRWRVGSTLSVALFDRTPGLVPDEPDGSQSDLDSLAQSRRYVGSRKSLATCSFSASDAPRFPCIATYVVAPKASPPA